MNKAKKYKLALKDTLNWDKYGGQSLVDLQQT